MQSRIALDLIRVSFPPPPLLGSFFYNWSTWKTGALASPLIIFGALTQQSQFTLCPSPLTPPRLWQRFAAFSHPDDPRLYLWSLFVLHVERSGDPRRIRRFSSPPFFSLGRISRSLGLPPPSLISFTPRPQRAQLFALQATRRYPLFSPPSASQFQIPPTT